MSQKKSKFPLLSEQIRKLIEESSTSRYQIWKATGIDQGTLSKFVSGDVGLSLPAIDAIGAYLGWRIVADEVDTAGTTNTKQPRESGKPRGRKGKVSK
jgi:hypothetical protein